MWYKNENNSVIRISYLDENKIIRFQWKETNTINLSWGQNHIFPPYIQQFSFFFTKTYHSPPLFILIYMFTIHSVNSGWGDTNLHCDLKKKWFFMLRIWVPQPEYSMCFFSFFFLIFLKNYFIKYFFRNIYK